MNKFFTLCSIIGCFFLSSCHRSILTNVTIFANEEDIAKFNVQDVDFNYFSAKAKIDVDGQNATVHIRMKKDSLIWLSISGFGIEVTRMLIRKDSIFIIDRLKKENQYEELDINALNERFNLELGFKNMQAMILGNLPYAKSSRDKLTKSQTDFYLLQQSRGNLKVENHVKMTTMKVEKVVLLESATKASLSIEYNDFGPLDNYIFAYSSLINLVLKGPGDSEKKTNVKINYTKIELTDKELNFPFNVPRRLEDRK